MNESIPKGKQKKCLECGNVFYMHPSSPNHNRTKYCGDECSKKAHTKRNVANRRELNLGSRLGLTSGKIGKINETVVAIDLVKKGWSVYTAFEDTHPFDILIVKDGTMKRVEVKTAIFLPSGTRKISCTKKLDRNKFDILATVSNLQDIIYEPEI